MRTTLGWAGTKGSRVRVRVLWTTRGMGGSGSALIPRRAGGGRLLDGDAGEPGDVDRALLGLAPEVLGRLRAAQGDDGPRVEGAAVHQVAERVAPRRRVGGELVVERHRPGVVGRRGVPVVRGRV